MAGELVGYGATGVTHDFFAYNSANQVWNGSAFVAWMDGDYATYRITATEQGTSTEFVGDAPTGTTRFQLRIRAGTLVGSGIVWAESIAPPTAAQIASAVATYAGGDIMGADALYQMVFTARDEAAAAAAAVSGSGNTLGSIPWNPDWDAEVQSEVHDALLAFPVASQATSQLIFNLLDTEVAEILEDTGTTLPALIAAGGGGGLTAQQVRDAMKLAPTAGAPDVGSVDLHLDDLLAFGAPPDADDIAEAVWEYGERTLTQAGQVVDGGIVTVDSASDTYCPVDHFLNRYDKRTVADYAQDGDDDRDDVIAGLATNDFLLTALRDASGMVESACLVSRRYTPADLAALSGVTEHVLCRLVSDLAIGLLIQRRPNVQIPYPPSYQFALDSLDLLRKGERVFSTVEHAQSGVVQSTVETARDVENRNQVTLQAKNFFGRRSNRREKP